MLCEHCQRFDIQAFGRDPYRYRGVPLSTVIRSYNHCSFCSLLLENLPRVQRYPIIRDGGWVNFVARKATKQPVTWNGLNVASIDAFVGSLTYKTPRRYVKFHVAADPGEMSLFSIPNSYARALIATSLSRHHSFNLTRYHRTDNRGQILVVARINRVNPDMA